MVVTKTSQYDDDADKTCKKALATNIVALYINNIKSNVEIKETNVRNT